MYWTEGREVVPTLRNEIEIEEDQCRRVSASIILKRYSNRFESCVFVTWFKKLDKKMVKLQCKQDLIFMLI